MSTQLSKPTSLWRTFSGFSDFTKRFNLLFVGDKTVIPKELEKQVVEALHSGHHNSEQMLAASNTFWWSGMKKYIENKCSACFC